MCVAPFDLGVMNLTTTEKERGRVVKQMNCLGNKKKGTCDVERRCCGEPRPRRNDGHGGTTATVEQRPRCNDLHAGGTTFTPAKTNEEVWARQIENIRARQNEREKGEGFYGLTE
ncbi:uncharacterized protein G2W53_041493 [Senna tora]|uniref:Uncharacterized protein n=1 Tax=Senna tora TaxID=362788 RepID=A0A834SK30_9FABA|nr:uncharacterized protein G2W53_041493 [Senna tora]